MSTDAVRYATRRGHRREMIPPPELVVAPRRDAVPMASRASAAPVLCLMGYDRARVSTYEWDWMEAR
jgi:hypothetical protein